MDPCSGSLRSELARLQEREATLSHLLSLEREKRVRAEHLFEVERLACFELGHKLARQNAVQSVKTEPSGLRKRSTVVANCDGQYNGTYDNTLSDTESVECSIDFKDTRSSKVHQSVTQQSTNTQNGDCSVLSSDLSPLLSPSQDDDFASSIFSQLPSDLQHMLGVSDAQESEDSDAFASAEAAVLANNPVQLKRHASGLPHQKGQSLLITSCERGHEGCVRVLMESGVSPNELATKKRTPLHICAKNGHLSSLKVLLEFGADLDARDGNDQTPIYLALRDGHETTVNALLQAGASLTTITKDGHTLLHAAVNGNLPHALRLILTQLKASLEGSKFSQILNSPDSSGYSPLHKAVLGGQAECVGVLCACEGLVLSQRDRWNRTPMDIATDENCKQILRNRESRTALVYVQSPDYSNGLKKGLVVGQLSILPNHRLSDIELLISDLLSEYCNTLQGLSLYSSLKTTSIRGPESSLSSNRGTTLSERIQFEHKLANSLTDDSSVTRKDTFLQTCTESIKSVCERVTTMDISSDSVATYQVGSYTWRHGELDRGLGVKTLHSVFSEKGREQGHIMISLKGLNEGHVDQQAFELMIPVSKLKEYTDLVEQHKALIIHGPQGSGKTQLARSLANCIKAGKARAQVVYTSLHPSFHRDDLFRLLHLNGVLIQQNESESTNKAHVVILDDLSLIHTPSVLAELLTSLEYRGAEHPMWVSDVYGRDGTLLYPCGHYYLHSSTYFIATTNSEGAGGEWVDQFAHVSLDLHSSSSVLMHHLNAKLVHMLRGLVPHATLPLCRMVWWLFQVWILYNDFVKRIGLQQLAVGVRHFIQCPVESNKPDAITSWMISLWNHHLAPAIRSTLLTPSPASHTHSLQDFQLVSKCLSACVEVVFRPCCPLSCEARERCMTQLKESLESEAGGSRRVKEGNQEQKEKENPDPLTSSQSLRSDTPSAVSTSNPAHKPPLPPQAGSMVSYEDMLRDSPRNRAKSQKHKASRTNSTKSNSSVTQSLDNRVSQPAAVDGVPLRPTNARKSTLRKIHSKTISLFSRDQNGTSSLPRLFKRGSRTSLNMSAALEESNTNPAKEARQLEDMFDLLSSANSSRFENQRSPSPPLKVENQRSDDKQKDLDDFLDMLSSVNTSRIEEQRSPPPPSTPSKSRKKSHKETTKTVPRYMLPTGSPLKGYRQRSIGASSPPAYSSPDLINEVEFEQHRSSSHPVHRKHTNTPFSSYDSDLLFKDDHSSCHCYSTVNTEDVHTQQDHNVHSQQDTKDRYAYRERPKTNDGNATISEPLRRRKTQDFPNGHSANSTPPYSRSPASPLTKAVYTNSPSKQQGSHTLASQGTPSHYDPRLYSGLTRVVNAKAKSVADIMEVDELGTIEDFDLFRAASEGDLMQSSAKEEFLDYSPTESHPPANGYKEDQVSYVHNTDERPGYGYQSSPDEENHFHLNSLKRKSSGYASDNHSYTNGSRHRSYSTSTYAGNSRQYSTFDRRHSVMSDPKNDAFSPTNSLGRGGRRPSDTSSVFGTNLLYSASLGFDSLPRLSSSRDHLSSTGGSLTEDLTTEM